MKKIIVTGASKGIGFELCKQFSEQGHQVLGISRDTSTLKDLNLKHVYCLNCDITNPKEVSKVADFVKNDWKTLDVLINNAGQLVNKRFTETSLESFKSVYDTNVFGVVNLLQQLLPFMDASSHIVNVSSMGGVQGSMKFPGLSAYSSSKGALITLTELLAEEYKESGPSFNVLALGAVQTEMLAEAFPGFEAPVSAKEMANYISNFALTGHQFYNGKLLQVSSSTP